MLAGSSPPWSPCGRRGPGANASGSSSSALVGVASAEICLVTAYMVLKDETSSDWAVILFGALLIASFVGVAKQPTRTALSASSVDVCDAG